jgi:hypothetical protein
MVLKPYTVDDRSKNTSLPKLVKERRFWVASFLVAWAPALQVPICLAPEIKMRILTAVVMHGLQGHTMWMQRHCGRTPQMASQL